MAIRTEDIKRRYNVYRRNRRIQNQRREREAKEGDANRLTASDEIESEYGHRAGTAFHKAIIDRLKTMKQVSSPTATNRVANISIIFAWLVKIVSILISYAVLDYIYENSISQNWDISKYIIVPVIFTLAVALEIISGTFIKNILNMTESIITRLTTFAIGVALTALITYGHVVYTDLKNTVNIQKNKEKVLHIETPETIKLRGQIVDTNNTINNLKKTLGNRYTRYLQKLKDINSSAQPYKIKAEKYQKLVDNAIKKKQKYIYILGKKRLVSRVQSWANTNNRLYAKEIAKKDTIEEPKNENIEKYQKAKRELEDKLALEYAKEKKSLDSESVEKGDINLYLQLLISFLAKIDLYGYFVLRHNIKNRVLDRMHKIIDEFNVVHQLSGVLEQFSMQTGQVMKAIGLTGIKIQNELAGINRTIVTDGNRQLQSNYRLIEAIGSNPTGVEANYQTIGDDRVDIGSKTEKGIDLKEREQILNDYVHSMGYPHKVLFDPDVAIGSTLGNLIKLNPNLSDDDTLKALRHELSHIESGTHKHNADFKKGVDKVQEKEKKVDFQFSKIKKTEYPFSEDRALEILSAYSLSNAIVFTNSEIAYFKERDAWRDGNLYCRDYLHLMDILDI